MLSMTTCHTLNHDWLRKKDLTPKLWNNAWRRLMPSCCYSWLSLWSNKRLDPKLKTMSSDDCFRASASGCLLVAFLDSPCDQTKKWIKTQNTYCWTPSASGGGWCLLVAFLGSPCDLISSHPKSQQQTLFGHTFTFLAFLGATPSLKTNKVAWLVPSGDIYLQQLLWHSCASC